MYYIGVIVSHSGDCFFLRVGMVCRIDMFS